MEPCSPQIVAMLAASYREYHQVEYELSIGNGFEAEIGARTALDNFAKVSREVYVARAMRAAVTAPKTDDHTVS